METVNGQCVDALLHGKSAVPHIIRVACTFPGNAKAGHALFPNCELYQDCMHFSLLGLQLLAPWGSIVVNVLVTQAVSICMNAAESRKPVGIAITRVLSIV